MNLKEFDQFLAAKIDRPLYLYVHPKIYNGYWSHKIRGFPRKWIWGIKKTIRKKK